MHKDQAGAWALILGALSYILLMAVHPSHAGGAPIVGALSLSAIVHGAALVATPVLLFGFWRLTQQMAGRAFAEIALSFYALAAAATIIAATLSGLVIPAIMQAGMSHHGPGPLPDDPDALRAQLQAAANIVVWLNRSFAAAHVGLFAVAMLLWSIAWTGRGALSWIARAIGVLSGLGVLAWAFSGTMSLEAQHGALLVTIAQMAWTMLAGAILLTAPKGEA